MSDEGLQLNINEGSYRQQKKEKPKRKERLKKGNKSHENKQSDHDNEQEIETTNIGPISPSRKRKKEEKDRGDEPEEKRIKSTGFVSSLFGKNPLIPNITSADVESMGEKVFTTNGFMELNLHSHMVANLEKRLGINQMTSVQGESIPHILEGKDVLVKSQTGSGKTLAYAVPIVEKLVRQDPKVQRYDGPYAVVIVPTRELAIQTYDTFVKLVYPFTWIVPGCMMGGEKRAKEKARIRKGINILVSTPGRLLDHVTSTQSLTLNRVRWLVIDEADRLLDMGFEKNVSEVVSVLQEKGPEKRQTVLLSATLSEGVERLAGMSLQDPVRVDISSESATSHLLQTSANSKVTEKFSTPDTLKHNFVVVPSKLRLVTLTAFILWKCRFSSKKSKMVVFLATQDSVDFHHSLLNAVLNDEDEESSTQQQDKLNLFKLHGEMKQKERTETFFNFKESKAGILLCTDVAARGLDMPHVRWIVQYNTPGRPTDYVHRVGRTARIGSTGKAIIFLAPSEVDYVKILNRAKLSLEEVKMNDILQTLLLQSKQLLEMPKGELARTTEESATALQMRFENYIQADKNARSLARKAYQSFIRAYSTYPTDLKYIFHTRNLHLGHVAKSFGLQEAPKQIGGIVGKFAKMDGKKGAGGSHGMGKLDRSGAGSYQKSKPKGMKAHMKELLVSEFSSGLSGLKPPPMKQKHKTFKQY